VMGWVGRSLTVRRVVRFLDYRFSPAGIFDRIFDQYHPDLLLATDIQNENDVALMQDAHRHGVPIAGMLRSWDNPTQRILRVWPERLFLGSGELAREVRALYDFPAERIEVT